MNYDIYISSDAERDIRNIYEYICYFLLSPIDAKNLIEKINTKINQLEMFPERYPQYDKEPWKQENLRQMKIDNYIVLYIPDKKTNIVTIVRITYKRRNIENLLSTYSVN